MFAGQQWEEVAAGRGYGGVRIPGAGSPATRGWLTLQMLTWLLPCGLHIWGGDEAHGASTHDKIWSVDDGIQANTLWCSGEGWHTAVYSHSAHAE